MSRFQEERIHRGPRNPVLRYGGLLLALLLIAAIGFLGYAWYDLRSDLNQDNITQDERDLSQEKLSYLMAQTPVELQGRIASVPFNENDVLAPHPDTGKPVFFITAREVNAMLQTVPEIKERAEVIFGEKQLNLRLKVPVPEDSPILGGEDVNVRLNIRVEQRPPGLYIDKVRAAGFPIPGGIIDPFIGVNLLDQYSGSPAEKAALNAIISDARLTTKGLWIDLDKLPKF